MKYSRRYDLIDLSMFLVKMLTFLKNFDFWVIFFSHALCLKNDNFYVSSNFTQIFFGTLYDDVLCFLKISFLLHPEFWSYHEKSLFQKFSQTMYIIKQCIYLNMHCMHWYILFWPYVILTSVLHFILTSFYFDLRASPSENT